MIDRGEKHYGGEVYLRLSDAATEHIWKTFGDVPETRTRYLAPEYIEAVDAEDKISWLDWLRSALGLVSHPPLIESGASFRTFSEEHFTPEIRWLLTNEPYQFLEAFRLLFTS